MKILFYLLFFFMMWDGKWCLRDEQVGAFGPKVKNHDAQRYHEVEGVRLPTRF
jgi:hypothetical protein